MYIGPDEADACAEFYGHSNDLKSCAIFNQTDTRVEIHINTTSDVAESLTTIDRSFASLIVYTAAIALRENQAFNKWLNELYIAYKTEAGPDSYLVSHEVPNSPILFLSNAVEASNCNDTAAYFATEWPKTWAVYQRENNVFLSDSGASY